MTIRTYRDLEVWNKAMDLVEQVYRVAKALPPNEKYGLTSQIQRAAVSIPANIAEGHARTHRGDYLHHLSMSRGSLAELETHLTLAVRLDLLNREAVLPIWDLCQSVGQLLNALIAALRRKDHEPRAPRPGPRTPDPGSRTPDPGPRSPDPGPRAPDPNPRSPAP